MDIFDGCEYEGGLGDVTDSVGADGDALECSPTPGEQGEAAFAEATGGAAQGVVGLVVWRENVPVGRLLDWLF